MGDQDWRKVFRWLNRLFMVPAFRLGLGGWICNPLSGYIMLLKTTGRKSGRVRYAPVNYAIWNGGVYCASGWGKKSHWYRNLRADPRVEVILPGGALYGNAQQVDDPQIRLRLLRQILKNSGFAGLLGRLNAFRASDEEIAEKCGDVVLIHILPQGIGSGPQDPGGWHWILPRFLEGLALLLLARRLRPRK